MKKSVSSFLDQMSSALNPLPDDDDEALMIVGSDTVTLSRLQVEIDLLIGVSGFFIILSVVFRRKSTRWPMIKTHLYWKLITS